MQTENTETLQPALPQHLKRRQQHIKISFPDIIYILIFKTHLLSNLHIFAPANNQKFAFACQNYSFYA